MILRVFFGNGRKKQATASRNDGVHRRKRSDANTQMCSGGDSDSAGVSTHSTGTRGWSRERPTRCSQALVSPSRAWLSRLHCSSTPTNFKFQADRSLLFSRSTARNDFAGAEAFLPVGTTYHYYPVLTRHTRPTRCTSTGVTDASHDVTVCHSHKCHSVTPA
jgi:hypothetical protein